MLIVNKFNSFSASISKNSDKLISSSNDNLGGIRPGSYIKIGQEDILYSVLSSNKFFYNKEFEIIDNRTIKINNYTVTNLQKEDLLKIIFDEYKLGMVLNIIGAGKFYKEGDILIVKGGELSIDISSGQGYPTKLKVEETGEFGRVIKLSSEMDGKYIDFPKGQIEVFGGHGESLLLELEYRKIENRSIQERIIKNIQFNENTTILTLDYSLPLGVKKGNLSTEKWEITLNNNYKGETFYGTRCEIFSDFTPNHQLPLLVPNSQNIFILFNEAMIKIDKLLKK